jgi:hypothetical protein
MLRSGLETLGYKIHAADNGIGSSEDFLFDDKDWMIRYLVVNTGTWLSGRRVLISPVALGEPNWEEGIFPVALTRKQVENSPPVETDNPVSRRCEEELHLYHGWMAYWGVKPQGSVEIPEGDPHLRSMEKVKGYTIQATDGDIGHVEDFIIDTEHWIIRYLVVNTRNWLPDKKVLVAKPWIQAVRWEDLSVYIDMSRESIKKSPEYDPSQLVNREYEIRLCDYYGRPTYWGD